MLSSDLQLIAPNLELGPDGCWSSRRIADVSYPEEGNNVYFSVEDSSFWFGHRNRCILEAIKRFPPGGPIFDVGGGNGCVAQALQDAGLAVVLVEPGLAGVRNALKRGIRHIVRATLEDAGVLDETLPAVGVFDVVEHIRDDSGFLRSIEKLLVPGGMLYLTVPAYEWLWSGEDILAGHSRRYTVTSLRNLLGSTGYTIDFATYFFGFLPLAIFFRRSAPYRLGFFSRKIDAKTVESDHAISHPAVARIMEALTSRELSRIGQLRPIRMGASCLAVARKAC
jgi:SAM-dependent methyltransferase